MTTRDIKAHLAEVYGAEVSPELISRVTEVVREEIIEWQTRPGVYVIMYIDALVVKIRNYGVVSNRLVYIVTGVDTGGFKHVLGLWIGTSDGEGAPRRRRGAYLRVHAWTVGAVAWRSRSWPALRTCS
jgi:putative transposase